VRGIEAAVPYEVALTWRCLAHASLPRNAAAAVLPPPPPAAPATAVPQKDLPQGPPVPATPTVVVVSSLALSARQAAAATAASANGAHTKVGRYRLPLSNPHCKRLDMSA